MKNVTLEGIIYSIPDKKHREIEDAFEKHNQDPYDPDKKERCNKLLKEVEASGKFKGYLYGNYCYV